MLDRRPHGLTDSAGCDKLTRTGKGPAEEIEMIRVSVELVGRAAEAGEKQVPLELPDGATPADAADRLVSRFPALEWLRRVTRPAVNLEYTTWDQTLQDGDEVAFIPPVSGG
jgi:molybdopterin converting factor small subunit